MERWEYTTGLLHADAESERSYMKERWPDWKPPKHAPQALLRELNAYGAKGWELVSIQPVDIGAKYDIYYRGGATPGYSAWYLVAFKRRLETA